MSPSDNDKTESGKSTHSGRMLGHYRILHLLGKGGMGEVFLAEDTRLQRMVAIKSLPTGDLDQISHRDRFLQEARTAARLNHPNICLIYSVEEFGASVYIVMEFVAGKTLKEYHAEKGTIAVDTVMSIAEQCCLGLQAAHSAGIIHRDIKPSNIMMAESGQIKIMDFGVARLAREVDQTQTSGVVGTPQYMSPEQITGRETDPRSDLFSFGIVLYELATGQLPFTRDSLAATAYAIVHDHPVAPSSIRADLPPRLQDLILRTLRKSPDERYQSAGAMLDDLRSETISPRSAGSITKLDRTSIAVFPMRNLSSDAESQYLAEGICEDVTIRLSKVKALKVASRSAVMRFTSATYDPLDIAGRLGVTTFIEGSIRKFGSDLRVSVQIVRAEDGFAVWSETYDRKLTEVLPLQAELAEQISQALNAQLSPDDLRALAATPTENREAYDCYLRGRFHVRRRDKESLLLAMQLFERAIQLDPEFSAAYAELSVAKGLAIAYGFAGPHETGILVFELANKAVTLAPHSAEAHVALGLSYHNADFNRYVAELAEAVRTAPENVEAMHYLAFGCVMRGDYLSAASLERRVLERDPFHAISRAQLCRVHRYLGQMDECLAQLAILRQDNQVPYLVAGTEGWLAWLDHDWRGAIALLERARVIQPEYLHTIDHLADCYCRSGQPSLAVALLRDTITAKSRQWGFFARLGQAEVTMDHPAEAAQAFALAFEGLDKERQTWLNKESASYYYNLGWIQILQGKTQEATHAIKCAIELGCGHFGELRLRPDWEPLQGNPTIVRMLADIERQRQSEFTQFGPRT